MLSLGAGYRGGYIQQLGLTVFVQWIRWVHMDWSAGGGSGGAPYRRGGGRYRRHQCRSDRESSLSDQRLGKFASRGECGHFSNRRSRVSRRSFCARLQSGREPQPNSSFSRALTRRRQQEVVRREMLDCPNDLVTSRSRSVITTATSQRRRSITGPIPISSRHTGRGCRGAVFVTPRCWAHFRDTLTTVTLNLWCCFALTGIPFVSQYRSMPR